MNSILSFVSTTVFLAVAVKATATSPSIVCDAGDYTPDGSACFVCPSMTFALAGAKSCTPCARGTSSSMGSGSCTINGELCPGGTKKTSSSPTVCEACPIDTYSLGASSTCTPCGNGGHSSLGSSKCYFYGLTVGNITMTGAPNPIATNIVYDIKSFSTSTSVSSTSSPLKIAISSPSSVAKALMSSSAAKTTTPPAPAPSPTAGQCFAGAIACRPGFGFSPAQGSCTWCPIGSYSPGATSACLVCKTSLTGGAKACAPLPKVILSTTTKTTSTSTSTSHISTSTIITSITDRPTTTWDKDLYITHSFITTVSPSTTTPSTSTSTSQTVVNDSFIYMTHSSKTTATSTMTSTSISSAPATSTTSKAATTPIGSSPRMARHF